MKHRIFVKKNDEENQFNVYDVFNISKEDLEYVKYKVFAEINQDKIYENIPIENSYILEYLPGQLDMRALSAEKCLALLGYKNAKVKCGYGFTGEIKFNEIEMRLKDMSELEYQEYTQNMILPDSIDISEETLKKYSLAMNIDDLMFIKQYFDKIGRKATLTELKVIDTYWSDHCRHTTFETELINSKFEGIYKEEIENQWNKYLEERNSKKLITLMDMATLSAKREKVKNIEISEEINACSVYVDVDNEKYILQFKNETHNHPTEIEPFGGASTCIGGAIRDPLSGRSYVYQAMRISGSHDPVDDIYIEGKLSSKEITTKAAKGYSSYGNQIGLTTTFVDEIYHRGYRAKRLELGFVVGLAKAENVKRLSPKKGDIVLLIGGATGRDGIGGATGSSKTHSKNSSKTCGSEVQKGNAIIERKIQRLFRNPEISKRIKKCNDFGAGGVCVAIGELSRGIKIYLDRVPVKYLGLDATEIAISESQERMAVVIDKNDLDIFEVECKKEDVDMTYVADITDDERLIMYYFGNKVVDIERNFLDTNGIRAKSSFLVNSNKKVNYSRNVLGNSLQEKFENNLRDKNICSKRTLNEMFDSTIGAGTVMLPYGGKYQLSPSQVSAQSLNVEKKSLDVASVASYGFSVELSEISPYHSAYTSVVSSISKLAAVGIDYNKIYFSFQEYFERLTNEEKWGKVVQSLLGANKVLRKFKLASIGGKDSMSGTFENLHVPPTLVSFAIACEKINKLNSQEFKNTDNYIYLLNTRYYENDLVDLEEFRKNLLYLQKMEKESAYAISLGGISEALCKMSFGNKIGFDINTNIDLFESKYGSFIISTPIKYENENLIYLGKTSNQIKVNGESLNIENLIKAFEEPLLSVFLDSGNKEEYTKVYSKKSSEKANKYLESKNEVKVFIPVFSGTNCEYDMERAFLREGAIVNIEVFSNNIDSFVRQIDNADILALAGGFSEADEPDGSAKFIANVLRQEKIKDAIHRLIDRKGLIIGICNGFQALIKSGLLPYGRICDLHENSPTLTYNNVKRHIAKIVKTKITSVNSPWLSSYNLGDIHHIPISHGEGRIVMNEEYFESLWEKGQIATTYVENNPNGSAYMIEGLISENGLIFGKMGHSERSANGIYINYIDKIEQNIFKNGVEYFKWKC